MAENKKRKRKSYPRKRMNPFPKTIKKKPYTKAQVRSVVKKAEDKLEGSYSKTRDYQLNEKQKMFAREYVMEWKVAESYQKAYPGSKKSTAYVNGHILLKNTKIQDYIKEILHNLEELCGVSKQRNLYELRKMAYGNMADLHNTWIERREFEALTDDQKACIESIETRVLKRNIGTKEEPDIVDVEMIKIKLFSKIVAVKEINRMQGYLTPDKVEAKLDVSGTIKITYK